MPHLFMVQLDVPVEHEVEFNRVYDTEHFPMLIRVPGVRNGARYRLEHSTVSGLQRYLTIYEIDSPDVLTDIRQIPAVLGPGSRFRPAWTTGILLRREQEALEAGD
jgi:hypothetical protein